MDKASLAFCILAHQREKNGAIGLSQDTQMLRGLSAYVRNVSAEDIKSASQRIAQASCLMAMIDENRALAKRITDYVMDNLNDADIRNEGVYIVTQIDAYITHLSEKLENLWQHS
jgi:hypothetical protein